MNELLLEIIRSVIDIEETKGIYRCRCPFHREKTPSFYINKERGFYHCFGCGKGGDLTSLIVDLMKKGLKDEI